MITRFSLAPLEPLRKSSVTVWAFDAVVKKQADISSMLKNECFIVVMLWGYCLGMIFCNASALITPLRCRAAGWMDLTLRLSVRASPRILENSREGAFTAFLSSTFAGRVMLIKASFA